MGLAKKIITVQGNKDYPTVDGNGWVALNYRSVYVNFTGVGAFTGDGSLEVVTQSQH